ncbi:hypothetical protein DID88_006721 [Monilinia fructigena]|uniref:P-type ATPase C-terminal domain-containing protein n=1 Tax=Monilinia fructigena TaxID=38457 RepID=A0A395IFM9_9HELO|nr:hypothetical protein DID88_006721 [Monilinia fructigena]
MKKDKKLPGETNEESGWRDELEGTARLRSGRSIKHARDVNERSSPYRVKHRIPNLYQYSAVARWTQYDGKDGEGEEMVEPISINNLLLRGCNLRNTDWILGVVVFTGFDTKIMLNSGITPTTLKCINDKLDYPCTPKSWNISDDLGQIEYIFSDKTGTLTPERYGVQKGQHQWVPYGEAYTEAQAGMQKRQGIDVEKEGARARQQIAFGKSQDWKEQQDANYQFMLALALCHSVISETIPGDPPKIEFRAQSPDEAALVATARDVGFTVLGNSPNGILLNIQGQEREYRVLNQLEFNSTRKRMSAIIRMPDNKIILFCLRTLCIAQRELGEKEYQDWNREHELAAAAIQDREDKLEAVSDMIERDLTLLGGTAIEDRLQEGVPDTIALLAEAGIKLWVLTGDKVETAINIGFSCNLLNNDMELIVFKIEDEQISTAEAELNKHLAAFNLTGSDAELKAAKKNHEPPAPTHAIVIDGDSLKLVARRHIATKIPSLVQRMQISPLLSYVSDKVSLAVPQLYRRGIERKEWTQKKFWLYMADGLYQSVIIFFMAYCLERFGVYIAPAAVVAINLYILINTYRWDWLMVLLVTISILLVWFWTGVYSSFVASDYFYKAAVQIFAQATFWAITCLSVVIALLPRFAIKAVQKFYFPYDVDIIREQVRQGKFDYLDRSDERMDVMSKDGSSASSSEITKPIAPTNTTHNPRSQNGSDGTDFTRHRNSMDQLGSRVSVDRPRPSFDRLRTSCDRVRPSFEASNDFTSAALLTRLESSQSFGPLKSRRNEEISQ